MTKAEVTRPTSLDPTTKERYEITTNFESYYYNINKENKESTLRENGSDNIETSAEKAVE